MIKLERTPQPSYLTHEKIKELTEEYKSTGKSVWNNRNIKDPLLNSSYGKCAYCECDLKTSSNYMEVEHFEDKSHNPGKVVVWENLLPSCKKCNGSKGTHDVCAEPIVNPYDDNPKEHFILRLYRLRGKTEKANNTICVTDLNNSKRLVMSRFEIGEKLDDLLDVSLERFKAYQLKKDTKTLNKLVGTIEGMLLECQAESAYSATTATILLTDLKFNNLVDALKIEKVWKSELENYYCAAQLLVLDCV